MKKNQLSLLLLAVFIIINGLLSCKKDAPPAKQDCKIVSLITGNEAIAFTYDTEGRLSSKTSATSTDKFVYNGNIVIITNTTGAVVNTITTVTLNANGLASNVSIVDGAGVNFSNITFEYNGTEVNKSTTTNPAGGDPSVTTFNWSGGNLTSFQTGANITILGYSATLPSQDGDFWHTLNLQQGYEVFRTKNVVTSVDSNGIISTNNFVFDADGKITQVNSISNGVVFTFNFQYDCN